jgi:diadenosine tetraphosphate (Ap4A) HIT family hydrolase
VFSFYRKRGANFMLNSSRISEADGGSEIGCAFCQRSSIHYVLKETLHFLLAADHAPLVEGHLLVIPKDHYTCYGDVPAVLDEELFALKREVQQFFSQAYAPPVFWEHGVFKQTVFHAHLHCFPWGRTGYRLEQALHESVVTTQEDIRRWYRERGHYFYMEDADVALLFEPEMSRYLSVVKDVFIRGMSLRGGKAEWRSPQQRYEERLPLIQAITHHWEIYQRRGKICS